MNFGLHKPCAGCPFRTDCLPAWLGRERAKGIAEAVSGGNTFQCHKTPNTAPQMCAGALVTVRHDQGGFSGAISLACAFGWLEPSQLDDKSPVFDSLDAFVEHHTHKDENATL